MISYDTTKNDTNEFIYKRNRLTDIENNLMVTKRERGWGRDKLGVWDYQIQTTTYKIGKQQVPTI